MNLYYSAFTGKDDLINCGIQPDVFMSKEWHKSDLPKSIQSWFSLLKDSDFKLVPTEMKDNCVYFKVFK